MKYFDADYILKAIDELAKNWNDTYLTCLCIHKVLNLNDDSAKSCWHQINKNALKSELSHYFDLLDIEPKTPDAAIDNISIIFANNYENRVPRVNVSYLAALCFRKDGVPSEINDFESLKQYFIDYFKLPPHFASRLENDSEWKPNFVDNSSNAIVVDRLLKNTNKKGGSLLALSLGSKRVLDNSAGALGATYFQTLYSKMNSDICLMTSIPEQYPIPDVEKKEIDDLSERRKIFEDWLQKYTDGSSEFRKHLADVLESWLDQRIPNEKIGNLFRYSSIVKYDLEKKRIMLLPQYPRVIDADGNGRPRTALNHYSTFLNSNPYNKKCSDQENSENALEKNNSVQIIYYGVPGCGKSHQIQEDLKKKNITEENHQVKRVVFHPDYCNADFVGQILPVTKRDGGIRYQFKAGPFTKILRDAYANPDKEYALIIEEINRGNAAAIFGDLFQLLDRKRESDPVEVVNGNSYGPGWSDYCVENDYINAYFRGAYDGEEAPNPLPPNTLGNITFNDNVDIRLPPNLSLYATMNTSDQNVFTLDNAFQRRWEMKQISNDLKNDDAHPDEKAQYDQFIGNTGVKWGSFREKINEIIMQSAEENGLSSMEDKRLGGWFIIPKKSSEAPEGAKATITSEAFAEKVLKYLWDDAFKFDRKSHFGDVRTLEKLIENFKKVGFNVFVEKSEVIAKLQPNNPTDAPVEGASPAEPTNPNLDAPIAE